MAHGPWPMALLSALSVYPTEVPSQVTRYARQELVKRLDMYQTRQPVPPESQRALLTVDRPKLCSILDRRLAASQRGFFIPRC